jgi:hypothetical protein
VFSGTENILRHAKYKKSKKQREEKGGNRLIDCFDWLPLSPVGG